MLEHFTNVKTALLKLTILNIYCTMICLFVCMIKAGAGPGVNLHMAAHGHVSRRFRGNTGNSPHTSSVLKIHVICLGTQRVGRSNQVSYIKSQNTCKIQTLFTNKRNSALQTLTGLNPAFH